MQAVGLASLCKLSGELMSMCLPESGACDTPAMLCRGLASAASEDCLCAWHMPLRYA